MYFAFQRKSIVWERMRPSVVAVKRLTGFSDGLRELSSSRRVFPEGYGPGPSKPLSRVICFMWEDKSYTWYKVQKELNGQRLKAHLPPPVVSSYLAAPSRGSFCKSFPWYLNEHVGEFRASRKVFLLLEHTDLHPLLLIPTAKNRYIDQPACSPPHAVHPGS